MTGVAVANDRQESLRFILPVATVAALFGATTAMVLSGLVVELRSVFGTLSSRYVLAGGFLALALGIRVPQRVTMWVCARAWQRLARGDQRAGAADVLVSRGPADRPLYWIVLSMIALAAGVATAAVPIGFRVVFSWYGWLQAHFIWSDLPLVTLQILCAFGAGLAPLFILGLALSCAHHMSCPFGRWDVRATGWYLLGAGAGALLFHFAASVGIGTQPLLIGASLPALLVAVLSAGVISKRGRTDIECDEDHLDLPMRSDRRPTLLRGSIVAMGGAAAVAVSLADGLFAGRGATPEMMVAVAIAAAGSGVLLGVRIKPRGTRNVAGFGLCAVACGGIVCVASPILVHARASSPIVATFALCVILGSFGFTTAYGREMLMARVASRSSEGSKMTARLLICAAASVAVAAPIVALAIGASHTFVVLAISLFALGGGLLADDRELPHRVRRARVGAVIGSIASVLVVALTPYSPWRGAEASMPALESTPGDQVADPGRAGGRHDLHPTASLPMNSR